MKRHIINLLSFLSAISCGGGPEYSPGTSYKDSETASTAGSGTTQTETDSGNSVSTASKPSSSKSKGGSYIPVSDPKALVVKARTPNSISIEWQSPEAGEIKAYKLSYYESANAPLNCDTGSTVGHTELGTRTSYVLAGLSPKTIYSIRVCAVGIQSEMSIGAVVSSQTTELPPDEIYSMYLVQQDFRQAEVQVSWIAPQGITSFKVAYFKGTANTPANCSEGINQVVTGNSFNIVGLTANQHLGVRVCSVNNNTPAEVSAGLADSLFVHSPPPGPVSNLQVASKTTNSITLTWNPAVGTVGSYWVAYSNLGYPVSCQSATSRETLTTSITLSDLNSQTMYYMLVCAANSDSIPRMSSGMTKTATTEAMVIPPVTNLRCPTSPSTMVTWDVNTNVNGYYVSRSTPSSPAATCISAPQIFTDSQNPQHELPPVGTFLVKVCSYIPNHPDTISEVREITCTL